jgi:signal transduction histidine kinase
LGLLPVVGTIVAITWAIGIAPDRMSRRRMVWLVVWSGVLVAAVVTTTALAGPRTVVTVTTLGLWGLAGLVLRLVLSPVLRPVDEPLVDAAAVLAALVCGAGVGALVGLAGQRSGMPAPEVSGAFAGVASAALILPGTMWLRSSFVERRYGAGILSPEAVAAITADLHPQTDARELLDKAAHMVSAATGGLPVRLVLGPEGPDLPEGWAEHPLVVGGNRVGTLLIEPRHPEGLEPRRERMVTQLLPTVALVARAVSLAVEAEHARYDVSRERDAERARILGDLHDGLGPILAGMSMRAQAEVRRSPTPVIEALAAELAECRGELRRIVSGLTPSALAEGGLEEALERLVRSFDGSGPGVVLETALTEEPPAEVAVAAYRSVAEGVTNALRHSRALVVSVRVRSTQDGGVVVDVVDDGIGGPIAPGVGLTSLRRRAEHLGGSLVVEPGAPAGTHLCVRFPATGAAA